MVGYGGKDLQKRKVLSLEWKSEGVMDDGSCLYIVTYQQTFDFSGILIWRSSSATVHRWASKDHQWNLAFLSSQYFYKQDAVSVS